VLECVGGGNRALRGEGETPWGLRARGQILAWGFGGVKVVFDAAGEDDAFALLGDAGWV